MNSRRKFVANSFWLIGGSNFLSQLETPVTGGPTVAALQNDMQYEEEDLSKIKQLLANKTPLKWIFSGDSITQGAKHTAGYRSYPEFFSERVRWELGRVRDFVINTAISGNTSRDVLNDFDWRVGQFTPNIVSLMVGTNDASEKKEIPVAEFRRNNEALIDKIRQTGAIPILQTPNIIITGKAKGRERIAEYISVTREVATHRKVILVDHFTYWHNSLTSIGSGEVFTKWLNDELHPNGKGHAVMVQLLFRKLSIFDPNAFTCREL